LISAVTFTAVSRKTATLVQRGRASTRIAMPTTRVDLVYFDAGGGH